MTTDSGTDLMPPTGEIRGDRHLFPLRVYWEDTDAGGIVYHASYLRFAERARSELLRVLGVDQSQLLADTGAGFTVTRLVIDYRQPARHDDALVLETRVVELGRASVVLEQTVLRCENGRKQRHILATLSVKLACVVLSGDSAGRPTRLPARVVSAFGSFSSGAVQSSSRDGASPESRRPFHPAS